MRASQALEEIYLPGGGRGRYPVETLALAVTDPSDITVEAKPSEIVLAPGESLPVDVTVTRNPRYQQPVNLAVVLQHLGGVHANPLPPGVTLKEAGSKTLLGPKETKGRIILQAAPGRRLVRKSRSPSWGTSRSISSSRRPMPVPRSW